MYIPNAYREDDQATLVAFMRANSFATLVSIDNGAPVATHLPLVVEEVDGAVRLTGHVAKANPQWQAFGVGEALAIFQGPHAYISPSHYGAHESVPTWNYIAVHAYGVPVPLSAAGSQAALEAMMATMIDAYEPSYHAQWESLTTRYRDGMLRGVVGFTLAVTRLEGKTKLSQNRSADDQRRVAHALLASDDGAARATGDAMQRHIDEAEG
ncbi:MAG: FMN-binding negative transcriptional regulator [Chloroflexales bacterium]|nr:FMN-binding negative transcriptional regulator [Chloroflexales bacterium]